MPKRVSVYQRAGTVYLMASHQTQAGFWVDDPDIVMLPDTECAVLGNAVEAALLRSRIGVPTPPASADLSVPILRAAGMPSWNSFVRSAKYVGVRQNGDAVKVTPYKNLGGKEGFEPMQDRAVLLPSGDAHLGEALVRALDAAEEMAP